MNRLQMLVALLEAVLMGLKAGLTDQKTNKIIDLANQGLRLVNAATTTGENFVVAMVTLTNQVKAMAISGVQDLTDEQQASIDAKIAAAHDEIQAELAARHAAEDPPPPPASTTPAAPSADLGAGNLAVGDSPQTVDPSAS